MVTAKKIENTPTQADLVDTSQSEVPETTGPDKQAAGETTGTAQNDAADVADVPGTAIKAAVLADDKATTDMHEDNVVQRDVTDADGQLLLFGKLRLWVGGAVQLDAYTSEGLYTWGDGGQSNTDSYIRRAEGVLRVSVFKNAELKIQYDFEANVFKNLYWRWIAPSNSRFVTVGNQKEPMGLDYLVGNKFATAIETSTPTAAFGSYRGTGVRYNGWTTLESDDNPPGGGVIAAPM